ncbi:hypothetical protein VNO80_03007 [Phaseolus coccineus]|uniref:Snakin-2 n=1 Tax=Phaseolus coccineus TaxID=3886 RepID=A0AAN9NQP2_PHACN
MALSKLILASLLALLLLLHLVDAHQSVQEQMHGSLLPQIDGNQACGVRCRLSSCPNLCKRVCGTCCKRCNCVPPGTSGNQEMCACYARLTTHDGKRKCP